MSAKKQLKSPAIELLEIVWNNVGDASGHHSWDRLNRSMRDAFDLALEGGFRFAPGDWQQIMRRFSAGRWTSRDDAYRKAICGNKYKHCPSHNMLVKPANPSAVAAIEDGVLTPWLLRGFRLYVGAEFNWVEGQPNNYTCPKFRVTSMDNSRVHAVFPARGDGPPKRNLKITRETLAAQNALYRKPKVKKPQP